MSLAFLALGLLITPPAQAQTPGYWVFDHFECQGDDIGGGGRNMGPYWEFPWISTGPTNPNVYPLGNINPIFDSYGDAEFSSINVTITPFFRWVPGSDPNAPPSILNAKITSEAYAGDQNGDPVSADNGFGDVSSQFPRGYVFYSDSDASSVGAHLEQKDPQGQKMVSLPPQTLSVSGGLCEDYQSISSEVDYLAETDNRSVVLHRDGAVYETVDPDGTAHGDTIYSYHSIITPLEGDQCDTDVVNWQTFHPVFSGNWSLLASGDSYIPDLDSWSWSPDESSDTWDTGIWSMPHGNINYTSDPTQSSWQGSPDNPLPKTMTYTATASSSHINSNDDGATVTAKYILTLHDQVENLTDTVTTTSASGPLWGSFPTSDNPNGLMIINGPVGPGSNNVPTVTTGQEHSIGYSGSVGADIGLTGWLKLFNINFNLGMDTSTNITLQQSWPLNVNVPAGYYTYPIFVHDYNRHTFHWKHFTPAGEHKLFDGNGQEKPHQDVEDQAAGGSIEFAPPAPIGTPYPVYGSSPVPTTPGP